MGLETTFHLIRPLKQFLNVLLWGSLIFCDIAYLCDFKSHIFAIIDRINMRSCLRSMKRMEELMWDFGRFSWFWWFLTIFHCQREYLAMESCFSPFRNQKYLLIGHLSCTNNIPTRNLVPLFFFVKFQKKTDFPYSSNDSVEMGSRQSLPLDIDVHKKSGTKFRHGIWIVAQKLPISMLFTYVNGGTMSFWHLIRTFEAQNLEKNRKIIKIGPGSGIWVLRSFSRYPSTGLPKKSGAKFWVRNRYYYFLPLSYV